jgi:hypothetical protein
MISIVISPTFLEFDQEGLIKEELKTIAENNQIEFWDYSVWHKTYNNRALFKDQLHLNSNGADIFSCEIAMLIESKLLKNEN